jgi:hypothetical protein
MTGALQTAGHCKLLGTRQHSRHNWCTRSLSLSSWWPGDLTGKHQAMHNHCCATCRSQKKQHPVQAGTKCAVDELPPQKMSQTPVADRCKALGPCLLDILEDHSVRECRRYILSQAAAAAAGAQHAIMRTTHNTQAAAAASRQAACFRHNTRTHPLRQHCSLANGKPALRHVPTFATLHTVVTRHGDSIRQQRITHTVNNT